MKVATIFDYTEKSPINTIPISDKHWYGPGSRLIPQHVPEPSNFFGVLALKIMIIFKDFLEKWLLLNKTIGINEEVTVITEDHQELPIKAILDTGNSAPTCISRKVYKAIGSPRIRNTICVRCVNGSKMHDITYIKYIMKGVVFIGDVVIVDTITGYDIIMSRHDIKYMLDQGYIFSF